MVIDTNNSVKTNGTGTAGSRSTGAVPASPATPGKAASKGAEQSSDSVVLSQEAQSLNRLQGNINELPDVDSERVATIRQAIADGKFSINADRIAENMLRQDDLLG